MTNESPNFDIEQRPPNEIVSHVEFTEGGRGHGHIQPAKFEIVNELPVILKAGEESCPVTVKLEREPAAEFFSHTTKLGTEGDIEEVTFNDPLAKAYFEGLTRAYRGRIVRQIGGALLTELQLEHSGKPGTYEDSLQSKLDSLQTNRVVNEFILTFTLRKTRPNGNIS